MPYEEFVKSIESLSYRDKFRLAQLLIQLARKEEEEQYPTDRKIMQATDVETIHYVADRILKLKPAKKTSLLNSIGAMFQFQGGISEADKEHIVSELQRLGTLEINARGKINYNE
jgi:histone acetyltransferase (RNA polymerase elongator complex component)